jgi:hypothetical protein
MEPQAPPVIPRYRLAPPTEDDALGMLARVLGPEGAASTWLRCCREAGVRRDGGMHPAELLRVGERLADEEGVPGVIGTSLAVRARTYLLLSAQHAGPGPAGGS